MSTKEEVIQMINLMSGCTTAAYTTDSNGNNESYNAYPIDALVDENSIEYLAGDDWQMTDFCEAANDLDMDIWGQELSQNQIAELRDMLVNGELYIASFSNESVGTIKLILWHE